MSGCPHFFYFIPSSIDEGGSSTDDGGSSTDERGSSTDEGDNAKNAKKHK